MAAFPSRWGNGTERRFSRALLDAFRDLIQLRSVVVRESDRELHGNRTIGVVPQRTDNLRRAAVSGRRSWISASFGVLSMVFSRSGRRWATISAAVGSDRPLGSVQVAQTQGHGSRQQQAGDADHQAKPQFLFPGAVGEIKRVGRRPSGEKRSSSFRGPPGLAPSGPPTGRSASSQRKRWIRRFAVNDLA